MSHVGHASPWTWLMARQNRTLVRTAVNSIEIFLVVLTCVFASALLGVFLRSVLPPHRLSEGAKATVQLATKLVVTVTALVLSPMIASANGFRDTQATELTQLSANIVLLDRTLAEYGPETKQARSVLREKLAFILEKLSSKEYLRSHRDPWHSSSLRRSSATLTIGQHATPTEEPSLDHCEECRTTALVSVRTENAFGLFNRTGRIGVLAHDYLCQLRPLRTNERQSTHQTVLFGFGSFRCNFIALRNV